QPVLDAITFPALSKTLRLGCARAPGTPNCAKPGPSARIRRVSVPLPPMTKPGIRMLAPGPTCARVEMLTRRAEGNPGRTVRYAAPLAADPVPLATVTV